MRELSRRHSIDIVFDLAAIPLPTSLEYPAWTVDVIVGIARTMSELARWEDIETLIHASSSEAYGSAAYVPMDELHPLVPTTPYAAAKAAADQVLLSYRSTFDIDLSIVRPFNTFGPRQNAGSYAGIIPVVVSRVEAGLPIEIYGDGEQTRDFLFVADAASAFVTAYERQGTRGEVINVASGIETSVNNLVARLLSVLNVPGHPVVHAAPRPGDVRRHCGAIDKARKLLDYQPTPITDDQIAATVDSYLTTR